MFPRSGPLPQTTLSPFVDRGHRGRIHELLRWSFGIYRSGHLLRSDDASDMEVLMGYTRFYGPISPNFLACRFIFLESYQRVLLLFHWTVLQQLYYRGMDIDRVALNETVFSHLIVGSMMALYRRVCF